jgi:DNA repair protein RecN (Recombination protein N)
LLSKKTNSIERKETLDRLLNEIVEINPQKNEDTQITNELTILENSEELVSTIDSIVNILDDDDCSVINGLNESAKYLAKLVTIDSSFSQYKTEFDTAIITIKETEQFINKYKNNIEFNPERIEILRNRFVDLRKLIKKYSSIENAINQQAEYEKELLLFENFDENIDKLKTQIENSKIELAKLATKLTKERVKTADALANNLINELAKLGIENATIKFNFNVEDINDIAFLVSMNKGETIAPISEVASGGEISRIMLALKTILAEKDKTPILIFDEIDTGTSGKIAQRVGKCMQSLSKYHQIISVTHLPQIAAMGQNVIAIEKKETNNRTITTARQLNDNDKIIEIAKMLSGENITDAAIESAKELVGNGETK